MRGYLSKQNYSTAG